VANYKRFPAPARPIPVSRAKAPGVGSTDSEEVPQEEYRYPLEQPHAFTGIVSRSRFAPEPTPHPVGHGGPTSGVRAQADMPEPNLGTQFERTKEMVDPSILAEGDRSLRVTSLGQRTPFLEAIRALVFVRSRRPGGEKAPGPVLGGVGGGITRASDLIRWSDFGSVPGMVNRRFTLRREFFQDAQTFLGARIYQARRSRASTAPVSMLPPRVSRLTDRRLPGSFGQTTEVLEG
jgi:hypothetical protein